MIDADKLSTHSDYSPGKLLLQARLQTGLTLEQVAKELYMTVSKVRALENDDFGSLNSHTFARGYIRAYANLLKMDVVSLLAAYDRYIKEVTPAEIIAPQPVASMPSKSKSAWPFLALIAVFFVGLWLISVWFFDNHSETEYVLPAVNSFALDGHKNIIDSHANMSVSAKITVQEDIAQQDSSVLASVSKQNTSAIASAESVKQNVQIIDPDNINTNNVNTNNANTNNVSAIIAASSVKAKSDKNVSSEINIASSQTVPTVRSATNNSAAAQTATQTSVSAIGDKSSSENNKNALDEISFSFRAESWLEVSDSRGDVLATELEAAGSKIKLVGKAPFDVKLGNAPAVDIQLNGKKIDVIPLLGSNVLTLKVSN